MRRQHVAWLVVLATASVAMVTALSVAKDNGGKPSQHEIRARDERRATYSKRHKPRARRSDKPNIVLILTDDQDVELGSLEYMPKLKRILRGGGVTFTNAFVTTPMCCPSRSSILTGMYVHNHNVYTNNDNCSSIQWRQKYEIHNFGAYLSNEGGYRTGYFGKYLNEYEGDYIPPGWTEWVGLIRNSRFYNYKLNFNGLKIKHENNYHKDYLTDLIANDSVAFFQQSKQYFPNRPVAMVLSMPAPHGPEDGAPQYAHLFKNVTTHKTRSYNFAPNPDKQWILQHTGKMEPIHIAFTDMLQQKRLQTLQSVDDAVEQVYNEIKRLGELDNTYFVYTSDHGYHIGQYGMVKGKAMPYEFDIKVPFIMKGPNIPKNKNIESIVLNVDIAPTMLDIAGVDIPDHMDGKSILELFEGATTKKSADKLKRKKAWRDTFLVERGKITHKKLVQRERLEAQKNKLFQTKEERVREACFRPEYQPPCSPNQEWYCNEIDGKRRITKCRSGMLGDETDGPNRKCKCRLPTPPAMVGLSPREIRRQRQFLKEHVNNPRELRSRMPPYRQMDIPRDVSDDGTADPSSREVDDRDDDTEVIRAGDFKLPWNTPREAEQLEYPGGIDGQDSVSFEIRDGEEILHVSDLNPDDEIDDIVTKMTTESPEFTEKRRLKRTAEGADIPISCRVLPNNTVHCDDDLYGNFGRWKSQKVKLDQLIHEYKEKIEELKALRRHMKSKRPKSFLDLFSSEEQADEDIDYIDLDLEEYEGYDLDLDADEYKEFDLDSEDYGDLDSYLGEDDEESDVVDCECDDVQGDDPSFNSIRKKERRKSERNKRKEERREKLRETREEKRSEKKLEREKTRQNRDEKKIKKKKVPTATLR